MKKLKLIANMFLIMTTCYSYGAETINLWGTSVSPYVRKVVNTLEYKKIKYIQHDILPKSLL